MDKKHIDYFYEKLSKEIKYEIFTLSLPLYLINKELEIRSDQIFKCSYDLMQTDIDVLATLYFRGDDYKLLPTQLYDALIFSSGGMTKVLKKLEDKKLIKRVQVKLDKRKNLVCLTSKGIKLTSEIMDEKVCILNDSFKVLSIEDKENLKNILSKILYCLV